MPQGLFNSLQTFSPVPGKTTQFYSLPQLEKEGVGPISKLPVSIRIVLESVLRNYDGKKITEDDVRGCKLAAEGRADRRGAFRRRARVAAGFHGRTFASLTCRDAFSRGPSKQEHCRDEPLVPVDLVIDHSVQVDLPVPKTAFEKNRRWSSNATHTGPVPEVGNSMLLMVRRDSPGIGICHQVNLNTSERAFGSDTNTIIQTRSSAPTHIPR